MRPDDAQAVYYSVAISNALAGSGLSGCRCSWAKTLAYLDEWIMIAAGRKIAGLLLVVDESSASRDAIEYVGSFLGRRRGFRIHLLYLLPPLPPELLEFGGAEDPHREEVLDAELRHGQEKWIASARASAEPVLNEAAMSLRKAGVTGHSICREFSYPTEPHEAARTILEQAQAKKCCTVVIGHKAHSWFRKIASGDIAERVLQLATDISLWIVQ
jgi:nucleotide-binding universal stress UspA family protein